MKHGSAGLATFLAIAVPFAVAAAQPADESDPAPGDLAPGDTISHESDEVIGPDDGAAPVEPEPEAEHASKNVGYDKGFFIKSDDGKFMMKITGRVQPFYTLARSLGAQPSGRIEHDWAGAFEIRRARLVIEGNLHGKDLLYKFQTDYGKGQPSLKDYHFDVRLSGDTWLRVGQWKRPFSRQQINSSGRLELTGRAITDKAFGAERDIGVALRNDYEKSTPIEWTVGVWNGTGSEPQPLVDGDGDPTGGIGNIPKQFRPAFIGRIGVNSDGVKGYSEADLEGGPLRWGAAASVWIEADFDEDKQSNDKVELDFIVKANGFSTTGGFYAMTAQSDVQPLSSQELSLVGMHFQAGYMVQPKVQLAARYAVLAPRPDGLKTHEIAFGGGYYGYGHDAKVQGSVRLLKTGDSKFADAILFELESNVGF